ncbi:hypothetical protein [Butyrivibrio sp. MC2013]|uniref:hypothetical protein n=1 Tax=Butyrivibrio sp. MC2013 TaxID=1280686 RepID=UPI000422D63D|nr:hypothetical protein [Butyrivibrio sp. MC2013]
MNELTVIMKKRIAVLKRAISIAEREEDSFPEGRLRVSKTTNQTRYYRMMDTGDETGEYLNTKQKELIRLLSQKDYNKRFLKCARLELYKLQSFLTLYQKVQADRIYDDLRMERKKLVEPYILTDELVAAKWMSKSFKSNPYKSENRIFDTKRGEKVRSKSESIIADILFELGIPYKYECPLKMKNGQIKYPDFTLLNIKTKEVIFFEHFGCMDDEEYRANTMNKMDTYRKNGIYPGKNLIFTYETENNPLDIKGVRLMLEDLFA